MSLSSERFLRLASSGDYSTAMEAYNNYLTCHCLHPVRLRIHDSHIMQYRYINVPCGSCYHCRETKINEWVTRMYAHCEDYQHVYFITLTYTSFYKQESPITKLLLTKLSNAVWHYDALNSTAKKCWRPCLLVKEHYQNFFKRLRKNTKNSTLTYVVCGEYGKKYGAPHFHAILFSKVPITHEDIKKAWSVALWQTDSGEWQFRRNQKKNGKPYDVLIGRIDFNDLVQNGTFNTSAKVKVDNTFMSAAHCFSYVCKYVCKQEKANTKRVVIAYNSLYKKERFVKLYENELQFHAAREYLRQHGIENKITNNTLNKISYEKTIPFDSAAICQHGLLRTRVRSLYGHEYVEDVFPQVFYEFNERYSPFVEFSRSTPIGSLYAKTHIHEFVQGHFNKPLLQEKGFVLPRYFARKADEYVYGFRQVHHTIKGTSLRLLDLPVVRADIQSELQNKVLLNHRTRSFSGANSIAELLRKSSYHFVDKSTGEHVILPHEQASSVPHYIYDRHARKYTLSRTVPTHEFLRKWLRRLNREMERYAKKRMLSDATARAEDAALCIMNDYCDVTSHKQNYERNQDLYLKHKQIDYDCTHSSLEP